MKNGGTKQVASVENPGFPGGANPRGMCVNLLLPPATKLGQGYVFTGMCDSVHGGGMHGCQGGMHGCWGCAWLLGGMCGCWGVCMVAGGACVVAGGCVWLLGACMIAGVCVWLPGGMHGERGACMAKGVCVVKGACMAKGGHAWDTTRYGNTINEWVVRILLECILVGQKFRRELHENEKTLTQGVRIPSIQPWIRH